MWRYLVVMVVLGVASLSASGSFSAEDATSGEDRGVVLRVALEGEPLTPITARFVQRGIEEAERQRAACLVLVLDTPGGLVDSTRGVVRTMLRSEVPVVVYVAPSGARAASAGVFVTLAAHVAAMAPGTHIGAAHPVAIGELPAPGGDPVGARRGRPIEDDETSARRASPLEQKAVSDTVAWAQALAELRGRNAEWAARAVRESLAISASEAVRQGVVDVLAENFDDLLAQLDGRAVTLPHGTETLRTKGASVHALEMWWGERLLAVLTNPNVAFLMLILGFYGIVFEFYTPGWGVAGTLGVVCMLMGLFALAILPINYVGLLLIGVALALFVAEAFVVSYGALTVGGVICLVLGGVMLVDSPTGFLRISTTVVVPVALATAGITVFLVGSIVRAHRQRVQTGSQAMVGASAEACEDFRPVGDGHRYTGRVRTHGELWTAVSSFPVVAGESLAVEDRQGLTLVVKRPEPGPAGSVGDQGKADA